MKHYGHMCLKRTLLWSTSRTIASLDLGPIQKGKHRSLVKTAEKYTDKRGQTRYKGTGKVLKNTQLLVCNGGFYSFMFPFICFLRARLNFHLGNQCGLVCHPLHLRLYPVRFVGKILEKRKEFLRTAPTLPEVLVSYYCLDELLLSLIMSRTHGTDSKINSSYYPCKLTLSIPLGDYGWPIPFGNPQGHAYW